ncbi:MAG TPA: MarR family winged helix-turn-helix transcriptional regulator [Acidimicrobiales bacterium]|nr:MarR family winged helix-turn-helix transcriptional regulator [Acidimicrobiales bacterium]
MPAGQTESEATVALSHAADDANDAAAVAARAAWSSVYELVFSRDSHDRMHDACESVGLTPGLMKALLSVRPGEPRPMKELAGEWRCDASYVTSLVDGLEERGIVERRTHPEDRRAKVIVLTPDGVRTRERLLERMQEPPACFDVLTPVELRDLRDLMAKLVAAAVTET